MAARIEDALLHPDRARLVALLREQPGIRLADIVARTGLTRNTAEYHLAMLRRHGLTESRTVGRWWVRGDERPPSPVRASGAGRRVFDALTAAPQSVTELATAAGLHPSHVMYWVRAYERAQLASTFRLGRKRMVVATEVPAASGVKSEPAADPHLSGEYRILQGQSPSPRGAETHGPDRGPPERSAPRVRLPDAPDLRTAHGHAQGLVAVPLVQPLLLPERQRAQLTPVLRLPDTNTGEARVRPAATAQEDERGRAP